ncbi:MAG: diguanylate cyclase [Gammaproteobacteria bacterium]|nr:diguanylate cyclase [Gammaproteobacteria bacterium]
MQDKIKLTTFIGLASGVAFWFIDALLDTFVFGLYVFLFDSVFTPALSDLWHRIIILIIGPAAGFAIGIRDQNIHAMRQLIINEKDLRETTEFTLLENATTNELTGLYMRKTIIEFLRHEINQFQRFKTPLTALFIKFNGFANIMNEKGEKEADQLLLKFINSLRSDIRQSDVVGHWNDDELVFIAIKTSAKETKRLEAKIKEKISAICSDNNLNIKIVTGVSEFTQDDDLLSFMRRIDV